jgi:hypothetical protein
MGADALTRGPGRDAQALSSPPWRLGEGAMLARYDAVGAVGVHVPPDGVHAPAGPEAAATSSNDWRLVERAAHWSSSFDFV